MFTKKPSEHIEDTEGRLVKIEGRVSGSQPMSVSWYKGDTEIHSSDKYDVSFKSNVAVLCIKSSEVTDSGRYTCQASNEAGRASCDTTVGISGELPLDLSNGSDGNAKHVEDLSRMILRRLHWWKNVLAYPWNLPLILVVKSFCVSEGVASLGRQQQMILAFIKKFLTVSRCQFSKLWLSNSTNNMLMCSKRNKQKA